MANIIWDNIIILASIAISVAIIAAFQTDAYSSGESLGAVTLLLVSWMLTYDIDKVNGICNTLSCMVVCGALIIVMTSAGKPERAHIM